jgi:hypothetical protein
MTATLSQRLLDGMHTGEEDVEHLVSDEDPDTALCGVDQADVPWNQGFPLCEACQAVADGRMS